jgi:hypothetical protein
MVVVGIIARRNLARKVNDPAKSLVMTDSVRRQSGVYLIHGLVAPEARGHKGPASILWAKSRIQDRDKNVGSPASTLD